MQQKILIVIGVCIFSFFSTNLGFAQIHYGGVYIDNIADMSGEHGYRPTPVPLWLELWTPAPSTYTEKPNGLYILSTGLRENTKLRQEIVRAQTDAGNVVVVCDLPGQGGSANFDFKTGQPLFTGPRNGLTPDLGALAANLLNRIGTLQAWVQNQYQFETPVPTVVEGHSIAGALLQRALLINALRRRRGERSYPIIDLNGAIISSPATDVFLYQKSVAWAFPWLGNAFPNLRWFPLANYRFWHDPAPNNSANRNFVYYDAWVAEKFASWKTRNTRSTVVNPELMLMPMGQFAGQEGTVRAGNPEVFHPLATARAVVLNAQWTRELIRSEARVASPLEIPESIAWVYSERDLVTNWYATEQLAERFPTGGDRRIITDGALRHGDVNNPEVVANSVRLTQAMLKGETIDGVKTNSPASPNWRDTVGGINAKIASCAWNIAFKL